MEAHALDEILWIPAKLNPLKKQMPVEDHHRLRMIELALEGILFFKISDSELKRQGASYTIDTLRDLKMKKPKDQLYLLLGDDVIPHFMQWKEPEAIIGLATLLIGARDGSQLPDISHLPDRIKKSFENGWTPIPILDISSTHLRKRLNDNLLCSHLMPAKVLDYIAAHHLYSSV
jgi:nicotinate-nucleotide adenylyltransferase